MRLYPRSHGMERRILARLMKTHKPNAAVHGDRSETATAAGCRRCNRACSTKCCRIESKPGTMDRLIDGDLAMKHENGACFGVEDLATEQPRVEAFEISPTGPMVGYRMTLPKGEALRIEEEVFANVGVTPESFRNTNERAKGERRALRRQTRQTSNSAAESMSTASTSRSRSRLPAGIVRDDVPARVDEIRRRRARDENLTPSPGRGGVRAARRTTLC